jgi:hypothetical protein
MQNLKWNNLVYTLIHPSKISQLNQLFKLVEHIISYCHFSQLPSTYQVDWNNMDIDYYSLHFKIKVTFGHKMRYKIKGTFGEVSLKLRQTNWNVAWINVNVVVDELPRQITLYNCLTIDIWTRRRQCTSMLVLCASVPSAQIGGLPVKLAPIFFLLYYGHP